MRILKLALAGLILTCLTSKERLEYTSFQVDGSVDYANGELRFVDLKGQEYAITPDGNTPCVIMEGVLKAPGADLRSEPAPDLKADE